MFLCCLVLSEITCQPNIQVQVVFNHQAKLIPFLNLRLALPQQHHKFYQKHEQKM